MSWLVPMVAATAVSIGILTGVFIYLACQDRRKALALWAGGWGLYAFHAALIFVVVRLVPDSGWLKTTEWLCSIASAFLLLWGTFAWVGRRLHRRWVVAAGLCMVWVLLADAVGAGLVAGGSIPPTKVFTLKVLPVCLYLGVFVLISGVTLLRRSDTRGAGAYLAGTAMIVWGLHAFDHPFLRPVPWLAPWGFVLGSAFALTAAVGMLLVYFERAQAERQALQAQVLGAQKLESLGVLAGGVAHEFNNLLVGVLGNADLALTKLPALSQVRTCLEDIKVAAVRAAELTNQMLAYSGKGRFMIEVLDLGAVVRETAPLLAASMDGKAALEYDLAADCPVEADVGQVRQVVMNLLANAADAIGSDEGTITIATGMVDADDAYLAETYLADDLPPGRYAFLEVRDTGCGMDDATRARLFDPFFTTKFTGRGLGLAAVLGIVRGHRGAIKVDSAVGRGTTVRVLLPCAGGATMP